MRYIKLFENFEKSPLTILNDLSYGISIQKCSLNGDKISTHGIDVHLNDLDIEILPIQFEYINKGYFIIDNNKLTTLKGCPEKISGFFSCSNNKTLMSLEYMPIAFRVFYDNCGCSDDPNQLKYIPVEVMKRGEAYNYFKSSNETYFIYKQEDIDAYWDDMLQKEPTLFDSLQFNKKNKLKQKSNYISWELSEKYNYLKRGKKAEFWEIKRKMN